MKRAKHKKSAVIKAILFVVFVLLAVGIVRFTPVWAFLTTEKIGEFLHHAGFWAPFTFVLIYAAGVSLLVPASILTTIGAALFGPYWGFLYTWIGAMLGASTSFYIGRYLGRDFAASLIGERLKKYDDAAARNGFATVLYLRLIYMPFTYMNFGMGLTKVRFWDYFFATALGIVVGTFIITFLVGTLKDIWMSGEWSRLLSGKILFAAGLFIFSFFIPVIIKKLRVSQAIEKEEWAEVKGHNL